MKTLNRLTASIGIKMQIAAMEGQVQRLFNSEPLADSQREQTLFHRLARLGNEVDRLSERTSLGRVDSELAEAVAGCQRGLDRLESSWAGSADTVGMGIDLTANFHGSGTRSSDAVERPPPFFL